MTRPPRPTIDSPPAASTTRQPAPNVQESVEDRRVRRTRRQLRDSLVTLILERGWDAVSVRDVCAHADVGRSTFYLHYADKESLLLSGFDALHAELAALPGEGSAPFRFALPLMAHAVGNERLFRALLGRQSGQQVQWQFREVVVSVLTAELTTLGVPAARREMTARFLAGGFLELLGALLEAVRPGDFGSAPPPPDPSAEYAASFRRLALGVVAAG